MVSVLKRTGVTPEASDTHRDGLPRSHRASHSCCRLPTAVRNTGSHVHKQNRDARRRSTRSLAESFMHKYFLSTNCASWRNRMVVPVAGVNREGTGSCTPLGREEVSGGLEEAS